MRGSVLCVLLAFAVGAPASAQVREPLWLVNATMTTTNGVFGGSTCHHVGAGTLIVTTEDVGTINGTDYLIPGFIVRKDGVKTARTSPSPARARASGPRR